MAVRIFKAITVGAITESESYPYDVRDKHVRGIAILASAGSGVVTVKFKDGSTLDTPRMTIGTPYEALFKEEIAYITAVGSLTTFDIELLNVGVS